MCPVGYTCPEGAVNPLVCINGAFCPSGSAKPIPCPAGTYLALSGGLSIEDCITCPKSTYCQEGSILPTECPTDQYSMEGSAKLSDCHKESSSCSNVHLTHRNEQCDGRAKNRLASFIDVSRDAEMWTKDLADW